MVALEREKMVFLVVTLAIGIHFTATAALEPSVIIVGAGMSGISAGKRLSDAGIKNIVILEATNWIGGRIHKQNFAGLSVEIGANWVEGVHGEQMNPIWEMVNKLNLKTFFSNYDNLSSNTYQQAGGLYKESFAQQAFDVADSLAEFSRNISTSLTASREEDISILASQRLKNLVPSAPIEMAIDYYNYDYEFAEPPRVTSLQNTEPLPTFSNFGEDLYFVADPRGYESVVYYVAKQYLTSNSAGQITDSRVKLNKQLEREYPGANVLLVTVTDDESRRIEQQPDYETKAEIMEVLRNMFGKNVPEATDILIPKWWSNRFYKGTFSNWPIGVSRYEYDQIRVPVGRVYFTGEHTSEHYNGYVHGAYLAGIDSANMLIRCIKTNFCKFPIAAKGT
ncbi:polyamine oxidase 1-like isoform X3 [Tasmannia lanceolata]|uniref:polyamine oxidase 1-like isoform X3 n=1 Tax=Tasmannia lanceolata TaxID=3420 RepID=UPI004063A451